MERRWLVERHAGNAVWTGKRYLERDPAPVGMADEMHLLATPVDEFDCPGCLVGEREGVLAGPWSRAIAPEMFGGEQLEAATERLGEVAPLARCGAGAMQGDHSLAAARLRRAAYI